MQKVAIIGTGLIGRAWAICFARGGFEARLWDAVPVAVENAVGYIEPILSDLAQSDLLNGSTPPEVLRRLVPCATMESALEGTVYVQESTPERLEDKIAVFRAIGASAPPRCDSREFDLCAPALDLHRRMPRPRACHRCPSDQPAIPCARLRSGARAMDQRGRDQTDRRTHSLDRPGADPHDARDSRLPDEPHADGAAQRGLPSCQ